MNTSIIEQTLTTLASIDNSGGIELVLDTSVYPLDVVLQPWKKVSP